MASGLARKAGLKLFEKHLEQYTPADPLYEEYTDEKGKKKRRKVYLCPHPFYDSFLRSCL
jgi:hypothetical protein